MLDDPIVRKKAARSIAADVRRGEDGDPLGELNSLDVKFFRSARVALHIPVIDPVLTRVCLLFLADEVPALIARMDRLPDRRSKSLLVDSTIRRWNQAFARRMRAKSDV